MAPCCDLAGCLPEQHHEPKPRPCWGLAEFTGNGSRDAGRLRRRR
jgi:hypothetical protein